MMVMQNKRKFNEDDAHLLKEKDDDTSLSKVTKWDLTDNCIARLQAVTVPVDNWTQRSTNNENNILFIPSTDAVVDDDDDDEIDDDDDDEDLDDDEFDDDNHSKSYWAINNASTNSNQNTGTCYNIPQPAIIKQDENGKSYLELGNMKQMKCLVTSPITTPSSTPLTSTTNNSSNQFPNHANPIAKFANCCDTVPHSKLCSNLCYKQKRLTVFNLSMCKLSRFRQCSDPSLRKSVLICNTLRVIEREIEFDTQQQNLQQQQQQQQQQQLNNYHQQQYQPQRQQVPTLPHLDPSNPHTLPPIQFENTTVDENNRSSSSSTPIPSLSSFSDYLAPLRPSVAVPVAVNDYYESSLREMTTDSGRLTPFPCSISSSMSSAPSLCNSNGSSNGNSNSCNFDIDSGFGDEIDVNETNDYHSSKSISWSSLLTLTSDGDLEPLTNAEYYTELGLLDSTNFLQFTSPNDGDWGNLVLLDSS